jgi:hypothetical protein
LITHHMTQSWLAILARGQEDSAGLDGRGVRHSAAEG